MKICFTCSSFSMEGGTGKFSINLVRNLIKKHDVTLVANKYNDNIRGLKFFPYRRWDYCNSLKILSDTVNATKLVKKLDKKEHFDIIHGQGECLYQDVVSIHGCYRAWIEDLKRRKSLHYRIGMTFHPSSKVILNIERKLFNKRMYKKITCDSNQVKKDILHYYNVPEDEVIVIPHGLDVKEFASPKRQSIRKTLRSKYGIKNEFVLLFVGHAFYKKGLGEIISAIRHIDNVKLLVVGNDDPVPFKLLAEKLGIADKVIFTGKVPLIRDYYFASDIFVFPTRHEPFGMVITEAMLCGLPVITSKEAGASEIMKNGRDALIMENSKDVYDLKEKINMLLDSPSLRKKLIKNGIKTAKKIDWTIVTKSFEKLYKDISNNR